MRFAKFEIDTCFPSVAVIVHVRVALVRVIVVEFLLFVILWIPGDRTPGFIQSRAHFEGEIGLGDGPAGVLDR